MQIYCVQNNISFGKWQRNVYQSGGNSIYKELKHRNDTWFFRDYLDWKNLPNFLEEKFKNVPSVNTYFYGCSDGSDAYSYIMSMLTQLREKSSKFMPVKAYDYDICALDKAKEGKLFISEDEIKRIQYYTNNNLNTFFKNINYGLYKPNEILTDKITFKYGDITKHYKKIKPKDTILAARNFWPYLSIAKRYKLAQDLYNHMGENSVLIVGEYDMKEWDTNLSDIFFKIGWVPTYLDCVFEKGEPHPYHKVY